MFSLSIESLPPENNNKSFNTNIKTIGVINPINRDIIPIINDKPGVGGGLTSIEKGVVFPNMNKWIY